MKTWISKLGLLVGVMALAPVAGLHAEDLQSYENKPAAVKVQYPAGWIKSETLPGVLVAFGAPKEKANLKLVENVSLVVQDVTPDTATLEKYTAMYDAQRKKDPTGIQLLESTKVTLGGLPAQHILCLGTQNGVQVKFMQVWTVRGKKAYLFTYGASKETYPKFLKEAQGIISSFKFI